MFIVTEYAALIYSIIQEHECSIFYLSYDIKITENLISAVKNFTILSLCRQRCYGRHNVSRKPVNH